MPKLPHAVPAVPTFNRFATLSDADAGQEQDAHSTRTPTRVGNATAPKRPTISSQPVPLSPREAWVKEAILATGAPERRALVRMLETHLAAADSAEARDAVTRRMEQALAARGHDVAVLRDLGITLLDGALGRAAWGTLLAELPGWAGNALTAGQLARAAINGSWSSLATVLPSLAAALPSLRTHDQFDALVQSLPEAIRTGLWNLHEQIGHADAQLRPNLGGGHLLPALAVAALLWQMQRALPSPSGQLKGIGRFIAGLPTHWQRIAVLNGLGGALLQATDRGAGDVLAAPRKKLTNAEKQARILHQKAVDRREAVVPDWQGTPPGLEAARAPGASCAGGAIATPVPTHGAQAPFDAARASSSSGRPGWLAWLGAGIATLGQAARGGFQAVPQAPPPVEMTLMGASAVPEVRVTTPLVSSERAAGTATAARAFPNLRRAPLAAAVIGVTGAAAWSAKKLLWPDAVQPATPAETAAQLAMEVVALPDGHWGTALDLLLGELEPTQRSGRTRRAAPAASSSADAQETVLQQHGVSTAQLDALRADPALMQQLQSMRLWSVAVARDIATQPGWEWVARLSASEQELLVGHRQALRRIAPTLAAVDTAADAVMDELLQKAGWQGNWKDIEVRLPHKDVAGMQVDDRLPLLAYCLSRPRAGEASFLRDDLPVTPREWAQLSQALASADASCLRVDIAARAEQARPALSAAVQAQLVLDALKAKALGRLGSGDAHRRGAEVVLGFLQGTGAVERATLTYVDRRPDGSPVTVPLPNYLVLRSAAEEEGLRGQVVLYRSDLSRFQAFGDEDAFREFLDTQRARSGAFAADGGVQRSLGEDIVQAAPPEQRRELLKLVDDWEKRLALYQSGQRGPQGWNPAASFTLAFTPVDHADGARQQWADTLVNHGQALAQQQLGRNLLRWSPLGIANVAADAAYQQRRDSALQTLDTHAQASVTDAMVGALRLAGFDGSLAGFDPSRVRLQLGEQRMDLTRWATRGWQQHGLPRPPVPLNAPDWAPDAAGMPNARLPQATWLDDATLDAMQLVAWRGDAQGGVDTELTARLADPALRRAICGELESFATSNRLATAYIDHLRALPRTGEGRAFAAALGNQIRARTAWMIEVARQDGLLDAATHAALQTAHAQLDPVGTRTSTLEVVTLNGHPLVGLWAILTPVGRQVFLPDTPHGDQVLDQRAFGLWLRRPEAEAYVRARAQYRYHPDLAAAFEHTASSRGIPFGFAATRGPQAAATLIAARIDDVDELTVSPHEQLVETLRVIGTIGVGALCSLASGGTGTLLCLAGTLGVVVDSVHRGLAYLERGLVDDGILEIGGGLVDLLDPAQITAIPGLLYQLGKRSLGSIAEATAAVRQLRLQARGFSADGQVNQGFAVSDTALAAAALPMLEQPVAAGGRIYRQGRRAYIEQGGHYVEAAASDGNALRLHMPDAPEQVGPPVEFRNNAWYRQERPPTRRGTTTLSPVGRREWVSRLPEAENLPPEKLDELEAVFGVRSRDASPSADLRHVVQELTIDQRVQRILGDPESLGMPGDEAIIVRAWADSPALGNGKGVETYVDTIGEWTRGARFGRGPVGLMVEVADTRTLPGIEALVDAADATALATRLKLPADTGRDALLQAVRSELGRVIKADPAQSRLTWQRWIAAQHRLPTAADNLVKHFPDLTKAEAEEIITRSNGLQKREVESWIFSADIRAIVADTLTSRTQRQQRQAVVNDAFGTLADVQQLATHLQSALPGRTVKVRDDGQGGSVLLVGSATPGVAEARLAFSPGAAGGLIVSDAQRKVHAHWQDALFEQLAAPEQRRLGDATTLRREVVEQMKQMPIAQRCSLRGPLKPVPDSSPNSDARTHERTRRSADCDPPNSISLGPEMIALRDDMQRSLGAMRHELDRTYTSLRAEERELKALTSRMMQLKLEKDSLPAADAARMKELQKKNFRTLNGYDLMNAAHYRLDDIAYDGVPLGPSPDFPDSGFALSTVPRAWMHPENFVNPVPVRRVFLPAAQAEGKPMQSDLFRADYPLGADLMPSVGKLAEPGQASKKITLTERDLQVTVPGGKQARSLAELTDAEFDALDGKAFSDAMRQYVGEGSLLPSNARALTPGDYYLYQIRSCSESKILKGWFDALKKAVPAIAGLLDGKDPIPKVTGKVRMLSDSNPCSYSCDRRLAELEEMLPEVELIVFYHFGTPNEAMEWRAEQAALRVMEKHRVAWEGAGHSENDMRQMAAAELKKPDVRQWAEEQLLASPPPRPVPRLWTRTEYEAEGF